jgi:anti-sigma-K factor RskA
MALHEQLVDDLVLYAVGELPPSRAAEVRSHLASCPECRAELENVQADLSLVAISANGPAAPARSRERFTEALQREPRARMISARPRWWSLMPSFAAAVLAIFALLLGFVAFQQHEKIEELQSQRARTESDLAHARDIMATLTAPDARQVILVSANTKPQPQGRVSYVKSSGRLVFFASNFAPPPANKAYELWVIPADNGSPIAAGVFKPDAHGMGSILLPTLPQNVEAKAFAITVENEAGSSVPTTPVIMLGS